MRHFTIGVFGPSSSGKTIYFACLLDTLLTKGATCGGVEGNWSVRDHEETAGWLDEVRQVLLRRTFPPGTDKTQALAIDFRPLESGAMTTVHFRDFRGGRFDGFKWAEADGSDISYDAMVSQSDALILMIDAASFTSSPQDLNIQGYVDTLIRAEREHGLDFPTMILWSKIDEVDEVKWKAAVQESEALKPLRQRVRRLSGYLGGPAISCIAVERGPDGHLVPKPDGNRPFSPRNIIKPFEGLTKQLAARTRRRQFKATIVAAATVVLLFALWMGIGARKESEAHRHLQIQLAGAGTTDTDAESAIQTFLNRWRGPLGLLPSVRRHIQNAHHELQGRRTGIERELRVRILAAASSEPTTEANRSSGEYRALVAAADRYVSSFGAHEELMAARHIFDEKARYLDARSLLSSIPEHEVPEKIDSLLNTQPFPVFGQALRTLQAETRRELAYRASFDNLLKALPGTGPMIEPARISAGISAIQRWLGEHQDGPAHDPRLNEARRQLRVYQLTSLTQDFAATAREAAQGAKTNAQQLALWEGFLARYPANPIRPQDTEEGQAWNARIAAGQESTRTLRQHVASEREAARSFQARAAADQIARRATAVKGPLTAERARELEQALVDMGNNDVARPFAQQVRTHWEDLAYREVRATFERLLTLPRHETLAAAQSALQLYQGGVRHFHPPIERHRYVAAAADFVKWVASVKEIRVEVRQTADLHIEIATGRQRETTKGQQSPVSLLMQPASVFEPLQVRFLYRGRRDTVVATEVLNLLSAAQTLGRSYRGGFVEVRLGLQRPPFPREGQK